MQQKHKTQISLNPLNFSPIGIDCRNGKKNLESQYNMSSSIKVMTIPFNEKFEEIKLYWGSRDCKKDEIILNNSTKEKSNQEDPTREF